MLVADDRSTVCPGLRSPLEGADGIELVAEAPDVEPAPAARRRLVAGGGRPGARVTTHRPGRVRVRGARDRRRGADAGGSGPRLRGRGSPLSGREQEVLRLLTRGLGGAEIAAELFVGDDTAETHVSDVAAGPQPRDRVQAVVLAHGSGPVGR